QAEDGIRDFHVTGVQTCALPISASTNSSSENLSSRSSSSVSVAPGSPSSPGNAAHGRNRSENVVRHRKSASHMRSASCGSRRAEIGRASCREGGQLRAGGGSERE